MPRYRKKQMRRRKGGAIRRRGLRSNRYHGLKFMKETILKGQVQVLAGQTTVVEKFACSFDDITTSSPYLNVPTRTAIPALFGRYCIVGVKWTFIPIYTQASQGGVGAGRVCYAVNRDPQDLLTGESDIIRQDDCKFTNTTRKFSVYVKHPKPSIASTAVQMPLARGISPNQYPAPVGGAGTINDQANQVAWTLGDNKWLWLPTRVQTYSDASGNLVTSQYPDHLGLDVVVTTPSAPNEVTTYYNVYQTIYLALKEQD